LALVRALLETGQSSRALELLNAVWQHDTAEERLWFLRLWALVGQKRVLEALDVARIATGQLPGSAAVSYLHGSLEHAVGDRTAALEAALRAAAILPERRETEALLTAMLETGERADGESEGAKEVTAALGPANSSHVEGQVPSPLAAAVLAAALLHPPGSTRSLKPTMPAAIPAAPGTANVANEARRRLVLMAIATVVAAVWAVRDPILASAALAGVVAWLSRPRKRLTITD
jgi:hypothetical protein